MSSLTIPAVVTRNQHNLTDTDWRSLMTFFQKPGAPEAMIVYCANKLGVDPPKIEKEKSIEEEEKELLDEHNKLEQKLDALKAKKEAAAQPAEAAGQKTS